MSLLEVATQLTKFNVSNCVRFAWWAGEEEGLLGSDYYVASLPEKENRKIRMLMDYDMMASPNFAYQIYNATNALNPNGTEELRDLYIKWYEDQNLNYTFIPFDGRSDYDGFIHNGIPVGGIATGAEGIKSKKEVEMFGGKAGDWVRPLLPPAVRRCGKCQHNSMGREHEAHRTLCGNVRSVIRRFP
jgi:aminopeptidase Y